MRIDKFLWSVRFYKTRNIAAEEIKKNRISIGQGPVKSSKEVRVGDIVKIRKNQIDYKIEVLQIPKSRIGAKLVPSHVTDKTDKEQYEILKMRKTAQDYYRIKGEGRPTKKDRREIEGYLDNDPDAEPEEMNEEAWESFFKDSTDNDDATID